MVDIHRQHSSSTVEKSEMEYLVINNIPHVYHSSDLRNFFSQFLETCGFDCFHFRHRPEVQKPRVCPYKNQDKGGETKRKTCCCVIRVPKHRVGELIRLYHRKHWVDKKGETLPFRCFINCIRLDDSSSCVTNPRTASSEDDGRIFTSSDIKKLIEMHPPPVMPNGNVGTPTKVFLDLIRLCRLPPAIIKKLELEFPRSRSARLYSSVHYEYEGQTMPAKHTDQEVVRTANGEILSDNYVPSRKPSSPQKESDADDVPETNMVEEDTDDNDDDTCEEWERHESLHNDVTQQERLKERLFEEKIELKWEKGGSGLVFYTDAQYWDAQDGDFDEKTADDWDIDTSIYYQSDAGDKDARDLLQMRLEKRLHEGTDYEDYNQSKIGQFEAHTKGIGRRVLEKHGWKEGEGLGKSVQGVSEPIEDNGQHPWDKRGLGFHGEKLVRNVKSRKRRNSSDIIISTIYDNPEDTDPQEQLLRSNFLTSLSYRKEFYRSGGKV